MNTIEVCGQEVQTLFGPQPCLRALFHAGGHNPFSNTAPAKGKNNEVLKPELPPRTENQPVQAVLAMPPKPERVEPAPAATGRPAVAVPQVQCLYCSPSGHCIKPFGHTGPHVETEPDAFS